jgi:hypothetical protein
MDYAYPAILNHIPQHIEYALVEWTLADFGQQWAKIAIRHPPYSGYETSILRREIVPYL